MLSGGEPTVRDDLAEITERLLALNVTRVLLNTNGRRIARDDRFVDFLKRHRRRVEVYLQFDSPHDGPHASLRGTALASE